MKLTSAQIRAARALVHISQATLAEASGVAQKSIADIELGKRTAHPRTLAALRTALEGLGVRFIDANGGGPGVRLVSED